MVRATPTNLKQYLAESSGDLELRVIPFDAQATVLARRTLHDDAFVPLSVSGGGGLLKARWLGGASNEVRVAQVLVRSNDLAISADQVPPKGFVLTDLHFVLEAPVTTPLHFLAGTNEAEATFEGTFLLEGDLLTAEGNQSPFDTQRFDKIPVTLSLSLENGRLSLRYRVVRRGPTWTWSGLLDTSDFTLEGRAVEAAPSR